MAMEQHLDPDTLAAYVDGRLQVDELGSADRHIDACGSCRSELSALAAVHTLPVGPEREVPEGKLGRYHVLRELGRGSMGVVLRAFDPELARPVAIKLLRDVTRDELRDEARSLARLRHPNVVTVYDVFTDEHGVYLAMELVDGDTLRGFAATRSREQVLDACVRAGRGLAAAHDAGVIHRDFKPENVLCGGGGEVRVSDFGLARAADAAADGAIAGTPAYMAPEVLRRESATAQSDQYSYCMTVHEMLTGKRSVDVDASLPPWIARALRRGLAKDPADRFASMHELVAALSDDPRARRRRRLALGGVAVGALVTGALVVMLTRSSGPTCAIDDAALGDAWNAQRRQQVQRGLIAAGGAQSAQLVIDTLDAYAREWVAARRDACVATHERGEQSELALDRRVACIDRTRREIREVAELLAEADPTLALNAPAVVQQIRNPVECTGSSDTDPLPTDPIGRAVVEQARTMIDRADALRFVARLDDSERVAGHVVELLRGRELPRQLAEALLVQARVNIDRDHHERAEELLFQALHAAERGHDDRLIAEIWLELVMATGVQKHRFDLAVSNARAAEAAIARVDSIDLQIRYAYTYGSLLLSQSKLDEARQHLEHGVKLAADEPRRIGQRGLLHATLCDVERQANKLRAAHEHCKVAVDTLVKVFGPDHMRVAVTLNILGALEFNERDLTGAERDYKRVVDILERRKLRSQITYALALSNLGTVYSQRDDVATARSYFDRALAAFDAHHPTHPQRLLPLQGLASLALRAGDTAGAVERYQQVHDAMAKTYPAIHPQLLIATYNLALAYVGHKQPAQAAAALDELVTRASTPGKESWMLAARGLDLQAQLADDRKDYRGALALLERALAAIERANDPIERALVLRHQGEIYRHMKKPALAIAPLERAIKDFGAEPDAYDIGTTRYHLAFALLDYGRDKARAIEVAKQAAADLAKAQSGEALEQYRKTLATLLRK
jgi:eukaryotic-like serine/threonine-protein kinase